MRKIMATLVVAISMFACVAPVAVGAATAEPAKSYGLCVSKSTGYTRALERTNLAKSAVGACKSTETKITVPSVTWPGPSRLVFVRTSVAGVATETCARKSASTSTWTYACTTVVVAPSPSPAS